ncbi:MAG: hypothetical protein QM621_04300 [Aeromicrobium sp.]|uniref:hypothetical protein n=1 Tax=Aeromicrobium sp. TaxID=1871063 RepID=UPI0039E6383C
MKRTRRWGAVATAALALGGLTACGGGEAPPASGTVIAADVSGSAEEASMREEAKAAMQAAVEGMEAPETVSMLAFNYKVGTPTCEPLKVTLEWSSSSTSMKDAKESYIVPAVEAVEPYLDCAKESVEGDGTDVVGAIVESYQMLKDTPGDKSIVMVSDGCQTYLFELCSPSVSDPAWREQQLNALADSMKPDMSGVEIEFVGLARGADMQSTEVQGLRAFYEEFAALTGASVTFQQ